jgi:putative oxidoreductase
MFETASSEQGDRLGDWFARGGVALAFLVFGWEKFQSGTMWPKFFDQVGIGQWFRYFTGIVEIGAALLLFIPWTAQFGLAILACTMATAALIWIFILGQPANSIICGGFCLGLGTFWWTRHSRA